MPNTDYTSIWKEYKSGLGYQQNMQFNSKFPEYERFKMSDQWPAPTERTKNLPRPVFNMIDYTIRTKRSNVLSQTIKMVFSPEETPQVAQRTDPLTGQAIPLPVDPITEGAQNFTDYTENLWHSIDQDQLNEDCTDDAATNGTGIFHYYWDNTVVGGTITKYVGKLCGETLDALNVFFGNPQQRETQKQPYIIISNRKDTDILIATAKSNKLPTILIVPDKETKDEGYDTAQIELSDARKTTSLTKYYKVPVNKDNPLAGYEIYWTEITENAVIVPPKPLTPYDGGFRMSLYPIEVFNWKRRKKCIYGCGEVEGIIPNQKAVNWNLGMLLLSVQQTAWPKMIAKIGALQQEITNEPGEIIVDHSTLGDGVKFMQPPNFTNMPIQITDKLFDLTRTTSGVSEVVTGEQIGANMAASAIIALQNQARMPIQSIQTRFFRSLRNVGRIFEQFYKAYYSLPRPFLAQSKDGTQETRTFTGTDYAEVAFGLKIDVGPSSTFSESLIMATLDKLYDKQAITLAQYAKYSPTNVFPAGLKQDIANTPPPPSIPPQQSQLQAGGM